jgi:hypothetical protein
LKKGLGDLGFKKTANSGARFGDADFSHKYYVTEAKCKYNTLGASIDKRSLAKLTKEAKKQGKDWLYVCENGNGQLVAMMDFDVLIALLDTQYGIDDPL